MDGNRFDDLVLALVKESSRRGVLRVLGVGTLTAVLAALGAPHPAAAVCQNNGGKCKNDNDCCSGNCKRKKGKRKCKPTPDAQGCTIDDGCDELDCPEFALGFCAVTINGKPFCATTGNCFACDSDEDCEEELEVPGARCARCGDACDEEFNFRACVAFEENGAP